MIKRFLEGVKQTRFMHKEMRNVQYIYHGLIDAMFQELHLKTEKLGLNRESLH